MGRSPPRQLLITPPIAPSLGGFIFFAAPSGPPPAPATYQSTNNQLPTIAAIDQEEEGNGYVGGVRCQVNLMNFPLFALLLVTLLDEMSWHIQAAQDQEDAEAEVLADLAYERWLSRYDYPDHW